MAHPRHAELQALVDEDEIEAVLAIVTLDEVAQTWSDYTAKPDQEWDEDDDDDPDWWAIGLVMNEQFRSDASRWRTALLKLLEHAESEMVVGCVGAGPLEEFVSNDEADLRWLEEHAPNNPRLRDALAGVWCDEDISPATMTRLDAIASAPLQRPIPREEWSPEAAAAGDALDRLRDLWNDDRVEGDDPDPALEAELAHAFGDLTAALEALHALDGAEGNEDPT